MKPRRPDIRKAQDFVAYVTLYFEILIVFIVIIALFISLSHVPEQLKALYYDGNFNLFLFAIFDLVIGIELMKMFCRHDLDSVVEVMTFTVAREMVIEHMPILDTLIGIVAIAVLFMIRKYFFISALDKTKSPLTKGSSKSDDQESDAD